MWAWAGTSWFPPSSASGLDEEKGDDIRDARDAVITGGFSEHELRDAGAVAVFESVDDLRKRLDETPLGN